MKWERIFHQPGILILFREDHETLFHAWSEGHPLGGAVLITVQQEGKEEACYRRSFEEKPHLRHYQAFIHKFLTDPKYRESFREEGSPPWEEIMVVP